MHTNQKNHAPALVIAILLLKREWLEKFFTYFNGSNGIFTFGCTENFSSGEMKGSIVGLFRYGSSFRIYHFIGNLSTEHCQLTVFYV